MTVRLRLLCAIGFVLAMGSSAFAQTAANGSIRGYVRDQQGGVLPDAIVTATSPAAPIPVAVVSDKDGYYRLLDLPPGAYTITAELSGFARFERPGISVRAGLNLGVQIEMSVGSQNETVTVNAETPMLESRSSVQAINISGELQRAVPLSTRRVWTDYLLVTPGVIAQRSGNDTVFYAHGSTQNSHVFQVDGSDVMAAVQNSNLFSNFSTDIIGDVQVKTAAVDASAPLGLGAITNITSPAATDKVRGAATLVFHPKRWNGNNNPTGTPRTLDLKQVDLTGGGPIQRGRAWIFGTYRRSANATGIARSALQLANLRLAVPEFQPFDASDTGDFLFTKFTTRMTPNHQFEALYNHDSTRSRTASGTLAAVYIERDIGGEVYSGRALSTWGSSLTTRVLGSYNNKGAVSRSLQPDVPSRVMYQRVAPSGGTLLGTGLLAVVDNNNGTPISLLGRKSTLSFDATYYKADWIGSHEVQAGLFFQPRNHDEWSVVYNNGGVHFEDYVMRDPANAAAGYRLFRRRIFDRSEGTRQEIDSRDAAVFLQDAWRPGNRLTINAGVRVDFIKRNDRLFDQVTQDSTEIGPRFGAIFALTSDGRTSLRGTWGRIHDNVSVNQTTAGSTTDGLRDLYDVDGDGTLETTVITPGATTRNPLRVIDLEHYHQAYANEWTTGLRRQWAGTLDTEVSVVRREYRDRPALVDTNGIYDGNVFRGYRDGAVSQINLLTANHWNWPVVTSLEIRASRNTRSLQLLAAYTREWRAIKGTWQPRDPAAFIQPDAFDNTRGIGTIAGLETNSLTFTSMGNNLGWRDQTARVGISYVAPWDIVASAYLTYVGGQWSGPIFTTRPGGGDPQFGPATVAGPNGSAILNPLATAVRFANANRGQGQFTADSLRQLNLRFGRNVRFNRYALELTASVFNITNADADLDLLFNESNVMSSPNFRALTGRQDPRSANFSVRLTF